MPIGFWAVSRQDVKEITAFYMEDNHKSPNLITTKDINKLIRELRDKLDNVLRDMVIDLVERK